MTESNPKPNQPKASRRQFIATSATAATLAASVPFARMAHAQGSDVIKIGLVGCGGRGTGAANQAMKADKGVRLVAMGELFADRLDNSLKALSPKGDREQVMVNNKKGKHVGFDSYKDVIAESDVVLLATSPHFRPLMVAEAVKQGKHLFVEKPVATDPVNTIKCLEACEEGKKKGLSIVSGLCYRYHKAKQGTIAEIHKGEDGPLGAIRHAHTYYYTNLLWHRGNNEKWSEMEYQIRNWLYFTWLSGDHIVEQHIHSLDKIAWALGDKYPTACTATGGRIHRTGKEYGNIYDHFAMNYEFEGGVTVHATCRQMGNCASNVVDYVVGTKGTANLQSHYIQNAKGELVWRQKRIRGDDMYQNEHNELFKSIRDGKPIYNGDYMCKSTMMAIMGREAAYTGQRITWAQMMNSELDLTPKGGYKFGPNPVEGVRIPGKSKLV